MIKVEKPHHTVLDDLWDGDGEPTPEAVEALAKLIAMAMAKRLEDNLPTEEESHE